MVSSYFKTRLKYNKKRNVVWEAIAEYLQKYIPYNSMVLDCGAGYCDFINNIQVKNKYAIDIDKSILKYNICF